MMILNENAKSKHEVEKKVFAQVLVFLVVIDVVVSCVMVVVWCVVLVELQDIMVVVEPVETGMSRHGTK